MTKLRDDYYDRAAKDMADDIDFEVITQLLCTGKNQWTKVVLKPMSWEDSLEVDKWVEQNVKGKHNTRGLGWVFENASDANWFIIRWG